MSHQKRISETDNKSTKAADHNKKYSGISKPAVQPFQLEPNNTGLPDHLKSGIENLSGHSLDDVKVHYNSSQPAQLNAHAYAQGNQIHIAPGQEQHLPHEAWHVVQQKQGRVQATKQLKTGGMINDDPALEHEADVMSLKAAFSGNNKNTQLKLTTVDIPATGVSQRAPVKLRNPNRTTPQDKEYNKSIDDFERIQEILTNKNYYLPALKALNAEVKDQINEYGRDRALSTVLLRREQQYNINANGAPIYTKGLSGPDFKKMLEDGAVIPKDVGETTRHGEQTHRIQWYVVLWGMTNGFTVDPLKNGFNRTPDDLLIRSTKISVPKEHFPEDLDRGANVWHALFDMAYGVPTKKEWDKAKGPWNLEKDVMTSADLLGVALHGRSTHPVSRQEGANWKSSVSGSLTRVAPHVAGILQENYDKRYQSEQEHGTAEHLENYHQKKLDSGEYKEPHWGEDKGILLPTPIPEEISYIGFLLNKKEWDDMGKGFFSNKTPDGIVKMRKAFQRKNYHDIFIIASKKNNSKDKNRAPKVRDLYNFLSTLRNKPISEQKILMKEAASWDIGYNK